MHRWVMLLLCLACLGGTPSVGTDASVGESGDGGDADRDGRADDERIGSNLEDNGDGDDGMPLAQVSNTRNPLVNENGGATRALLPDGKPPETIVLVANGKVRYSVGALAPADITWASSFYYAFPT